MLRDNTVAAGCWFSGAGGFGLGNEYINNVLNKIQVSPYDLRYDMMIKIQEVPYLFKKTTSKKDFSIYGLGDSIATLVIEPGVPIEFEDSTFLRIGKTPNSRGQLICEGTVNDSIILTIKDDQVLSGGQVMSEIATATLSTMLETGASPRNDGVTDNSENSLYWQGLRFEGDCA